MDNDLIRKNEMSPRALLCVIDDTLEVRKALLFAYKRAQRTGADVIALACIAPPIGGSELIWGGVSKMAEEEARNIVIEMCEKYESEIFHAGDVTPVRMICEGEAISVIREKIAAHPEIKEIILAAGTQGNPGPLVEKLTRGGGDKITAPIIIIPDGMNEADIERTA